MRSTSGVYRGAIRTRGCRIASRKPGFPVAAKIESKSRRRAEATYDDALDRGPIERPASIDRLDREIIEALQVNGREPFRRIAAQLGVSEATVRNRYARLCRENVLQVTGVTNPLGLGFDAQAMIGVKTNGPVQTVADEVAGWREASYVVIAAGQYDILVELVCADRRHLLEIINRIRGIRERRINRELHVPRALEAALRLGHRPERRRGARRQGKTTTNRRAEVEMSVATRQQNFVGGEWVDAAEGETMDVINPATGETIAEVPRGSQAHGGFKQSGYGKDMSMYSVEEYTTGQARHGEDRLTCRWRSRSESRTPRPPSRPGRPRRPPRGRAQGVRRRRRGGRA